MSEQAESGWSFNSLEMATKDNLSVQEGDRIAIGELDKVIVIYSGYDKWKSSNFALHRVTLWYNLVVSVFM